MLVGKELSSELIVAEYIDVDPDERRQQEQVKEKHERGAACRVAELPHRRDDEEYIEEDDSGTAVQPHHDEFVHLHAPVVTVSTDAVIDT